MAVMTPVLLLGFNRPDTMSVVLDRLREVQPTQLFVAIDGPRAGRSEDDNKVQQCRDLVDEIDWDCEVRTLFQNENLGCGLGVSTAISWFFDQVQEGIILEDDIVPDPSFFAFCTDLLDRYRNDHRIFAISGCNYVPQAYLAQPDASYRFSRVPHIWGWATWRRSWHQYELNIADWRRRLPIRRLWADVQHSVPATAYWTGTFELLGRGQIDTWDGQLVLAAMAAGQLTATSNTNLVDNIGFGPNATHTFQDRKELQAASQMTLPIQACRVEVDQGADKWTRKHHYRATWQGVTMQVADFLKTKVRRP